MDIDCNPYESASQRKKRLAAEFNENREVELQERKERIAAKEAYYKSPEGREALAKARRVLAVGAVLFNPQ